MSIYLIIFYHNNRLRQGHFIFEYDICYVIQALFFVASNTTVEIVVVRAE
jgi:hypothetical protein